MKKLWLAIFAALALAGCGEQLVEFPIDFSIPPDLASDLADGGAAPADLGDGGG